MKDELCLCTDFNGRIKLTTKMNEQKIMANGPTTNYRHNLHICVSQARKKDL